MRTIELLAPAKNLECAIAAIDSGADAVYIGGPSYGARVNASNKIEDIKSICDYAHLFGVKVHVTLNTILTDEELKVARELTFKLYDIGVDALIVQDLGLINGPLPPLEIHASTQQDNSSLEKVKFLEEAGFDQVVLARELSLKEIRNIKNNTNVKLEAFIHGALCVGMSGRCYLSEVITERSANRGECAQLCRVAQSLYDSNNNCLAKDKYLLSLKDLNQSKNLEELINIGISSFKIEGRLKDVNYVKNVTSWYRKLIDDIIKTKTDIVKSSYGTITTLYTPDVSKSFNRGFTEYNAHEIKNNYANFDAPGFVGNKIGTLVKQNNHWLKICLNKGLQLNNGDSLNYYDQNGILNGFRVSTVQNGNEIEVFQELPKIQLNTIFYRNKDADFEKKLSNPKATTRKLKLQLVYNETDKEIIITAIDEMNDSVTEIYTLDEIQIANNIDSLKKNLLEKLSRLGDTIYTLTKLDFNLKYNYFIPQSVLNQLRRNVISKLYTKKQNLRRNIKHNFINAPLLPKSEQNLGFKANILNKSAKDFYENHGAINVTYALEKHCKKQTNQSDVSNKIILVSKHCLRFCFGKCPIHHHVKPEDLYLKIGNETFKLEFDCKKCLMLVKTINK
ncbi:MAG: U32 family peptidase [Succinivibrionaceae bacterium]